MSSAKEPVKWSTANSKKTLEKVLVEKDGTVRDPGTLELIGHHFTIDGVRYFMGVGPFPLVKKDNDK